MKEYSANSIQTLQPLQAMREKMGMYFGSSGADALHHAVKEIISNSIDEHLQGFGNKIEIKIAPTEITVRDFGRGIPFEKIQEVCTKPHSSGKLKTGESAYQASGGLNGIGIKLLTATGIISVSSFRNGKMATATYSINHTAEQPIITPSKLQNGTQITWKPDGEPFKNAKFEVSRIEDLIEQMLYLLPNLEVSINGKTLKKSSMLDFFDDYLYEEHNITKPFCGKYKVGETAVAVALVWNTKNSVSSSFVNLIPTPDGGTHITALRTTLTREFNAKFGTSFSGDEIRRNLSLLVGITSNIELDFVGQAKSKLATTELTADFNTCFKAAIQEMFSKDVDGFRKLVKLLTKINKAADIEKAMKSISQKPKTAFNNLTKKYIGCKANKGIEFALVEGSSAGESLKLQRKDYQAIFAVRGKMLNVFDLETNEVLQNAEIRELMDILGKPSEAMKKFDKIIFAHDADYDGAHIGLLMLNFFARYYKELLFAGKLYSPVLPTYMGRKGDKIAFAYTEEEKNKLVGYDISFLKGLGELDDELLAPFIWNKNTRKLKQLTCSPNEYDELIESLAITFSKTAENANARREIFS